MRHATTLGLGVIFLAAGALAGEFLSRTPVVHRLLARLFGRGELVAMVDHRGVFDRDGIADEVLRFSDATAPTNKDELERAMFVLRGQFDGDRGFAAALRANRLWRFQLRGMSADVFRGE